MTEMAGQNTLKVDIKRDNLVFYLEGEKINGKVEVRKDENSPSVFKIINGDREVRVINLPELEIIDQFDFLLLILSKPDILELLFGNDYRNIDKVMLNAELEEAQLWDMFGFMGLDNLLLKAGFMRAINFGEDNVYEYFHTNGDTLRIYAVKIRKGKELMFLIHRLEGVIKLK